MRMIIVWVLVIVGIVLAGLVIWRQLDHRADRAEMDRLAGFQPARPQTFSAEMVADLPEPARRFFTFSIAEGTLLHTVARIEMAGQFGMGDKAAPGYLPMQATQVLAAPEGFIWAMSSGAGITRLSGSDSGSWTRFWLNGLAPVARFGGTPDHTRSAFGRYVAEAVFWTPAAVLPGPNVIWEPVSDDVARMTMRRGDLEQMVEITVDPDGRPLHVSFLRWSDANPQKQHQFQPFGGYLSEFKIFEGFTLPTHVEAGNFFGTEDYFPFFLVDVSAIVFPDATR